MSTAGEGAPVSVVIVSRGRPRHLARCISALRLQTHRCFELIVVADPEGLAAARAAPFGPDVVAIPFDEANISAARNLGIAAARAPIVAFIDDDAIAEPTWLAHLTAPIAEGRADAATGYVRGRNGISWQWQAQVVDRTGESHPLELAGEAAVVPEPGPGLAVRTHGTNAAYRREALAALGGFDESFRFYLDETDLDRRLAAAGFRTAVVPLAQVQHGWAPSAHRRGRAPRDLFEIGASKAHFLAVHAPDALEEALAGFRARWRRRLLQLMVAGELTPGDVPRLLARLDAGFAEGRRRAPCLRRLAPAAGPLRPFAADRPPWRGVAVVARPALWLAQTSRFTRKRL